MPGITVRWRIFALLFCFGLFAYVQQRCITVASVQMMPALHLSQLQLGWLEEALLLGYTVFQFPGGLLGQRLGARRALTWISAVGLAATLLTPAAPYFAGASIVFATLLLLQLVVGAAQAPIYPVCAGVFESWFPPHDWPRVQGLQSMGLQLGAALTPWVISRLMVESGWQRAIELANLPVLAIVIIWAIYARNTPREHPHVRAAELADLATADPAGAAIPAAAPPGSSFLRLLANRDLLLLSGSYLCLNYVFYLLANWVFLYLVQERHFAVLDGGLLAVLPPLAAAVGAGGGGMLTSTLLRRRGPRRGLRIVPLISLPAAGGLIWLAVRANDPHVAVVALTLAYFCIEVNEGPYWAATMYIGGSEAMAAGGILNTGGNAGGLIATPLIGWLSGRHQWSIAFAVGSVLAVMGGSAWLAIDPVRQRRAAGELPP